MCICVGGGSIVYVSQAYVNLLALLSCGSLPLQSLIWKKSIAVNENIHFHVNGLF